MEVKGEFTLCTLEGEFRGTGTDHYIGTTVNGEQRVVEKRELMSVDIDAMMRGYIDMGDINRELAEEASSTFMDGMSFYDGLED